MNIYDVFRKLDINYKEVSHKAVFTVEEAKFIEESIEGVGCKNLFLTDKKNHYFLLVLEENKRADIKSIAKIAWVSSLSFASDDALFKILGVRPGSVTPLGIINDRECLVNLFIDRNLCNKKILVHPNVNTKTVSIECSDLIKFIDYLNHKYIFI